MIMLQKIIAFKYFDKELLQIQNLSFNNIINNMFTTNGQLIMSPEQLQTAIKNKLCNEPCSIIHQGGCNMNAVQHFKNGCASAYKIYLVVHLIPFLIFKTKKLAKNPKKQIIKFLIGFIRSLLFAGGYTAMVLRTVCFITNHYKFQGNVGTVIPGIVAGITLNFEPITRQSQIALFTLNKSIQTAYNIGLRRKLYKGIPYGQNLVMGIASAIILYHFINNKQAIRENYLSTMNILFSQK